MTSFNNKTDFSTLLSHAKAVQLLQRLIDLTSLPKDNDLLNLECKTLEHKAHLKKWQQEWQTLYIDKVEDSNQPTLIANDEQIDSGEQAATDWLILVFNTLFADQKVVLARGLGEPEYFPACNNQPARIEFAHGFFASALHEISHWCVAGKTRRTLSDFGYWYAPDGRSAAQQQAFERVEIKPQALECLFTLACDRPFQVSQDNLFATFDTSGSTFANDVYLQAEEYIAKPHTLPHDAKVLLCTFLAMRFNVCTSEPL
ncbi:elongation factor P hydroxylase [Psychrobacter sp. B38]|uniref:elongation factor P hydroxylase n=1 Tax=Psychrobacter sp. B38 TaxID=3143538 RepID=UPI00321079D7